MVRENLYTKDDEPKDLRELSRWPLRSYKKHNLAEMVVPTSRC